MSYWRTFTFLSCCLFLVAITDHRADGSSTKNQTSPEVTTDQTLASDVAVHPLTVPDGAGPPGEAASNLQSNSPLSPPSLNRSPLLMASNEDNQTDDATGTKLQNSSRSRSRISGSIPADSQTPSAEMEELRKFEESAFPHTSAAETSNLNLRRGLIEGNSPSQTSKRPSAEYPPADLLTPPPQSMMPQGAPRPPEAWLAQLALPDLPVRWDSKLVRYLEFYRTNPRGRAIMSTWLRRLSRHQRLIGEVLHQHGLPQDLIYLAMIESGFEPKRTSRVGATGIWQFMLSPAKSYGLSRSHWIDERRNPELSTDAAARYLKDLFDRFGSWEMAMAAYNAGHGAIIRSMQKYNSNNYWQLASYEAGLPWETTLYVPKILAAAIVGHNREFFGYDKLPPDNEWRFDLVAVPSSITLSQAAQAAGVSREEMEALNPELRRGRTPPEKSWLRVPKGTEEHFYQTLATMKSGLFKYKPYVVRLGDSDEEIARRFGLSKRALRDLNGIRDALELRPGLTILVPAAAPKEKTDKKSADNNDENKDTDDNDSASEEEDKNTGTATDTDGDDATSSVIAEEGTEDLLLVPLPQGLPSQVPGRKRIFYRTVIGDSLPEIASYLQVRVVDLALWNNLEAKGKLVSGMVIQAFVAPDFDENSVVLLDPKRIQLMTAGSDEFLNLYEKRKGRTRLLYQVRSGDTINSLSKKFGLTVGSFLRINRLERLAKLKSGQTVIAYVEAAKMRKINAAAPKALAKKTKEKIKDKELPEENSADNDSASKKMATEQASPEKPARTAIQ